MVANIFRGVAGVVLLLMALVPATAEGQQIKVTLLGTGTPPPVMNRFGPSILVEAGGQKVLFDAGGEVLCNASPSSESGGRTWMGSSSRIFTRITSSAVRISG